ncbi:competence type IV pilus minor pilin ComGF [Bacillus spizizenii]|uniref:competence type IV pilus minor pilin ComGF n=1 Tax=Bacillus spizizenii TaxID=96241 RepID=UPI00165C8282|nr:competence type IV pilus minor pilin ComGF [Bacillus spizizenii]MCY7807283.1 competence protein ComG [Bacillus spizizenii]MCY7812697.1 competence protein ComG [Bacillus spizizenii]MCY7827529.1 competence protein ComG [Bacillus spizizenii]MCY7841391.1 competence protein ComG [Bacillus spizizenii]MCY7872250.1 competence protein ComG [Bacillus spizizenii]
MLISGSLAMIFHLFLSRQQEYKGFTQQEWLISMEQMMNECKQSHAVKTAEHGSVLICTNPSGQDIRFEIYHSMIRKRVDGKGHVPILDNITAMRADIENGVVLLKIKSENQKVYQTAFPVYSYLGGG